MLLGFHVVLQGFGVGFDKFLWTKQPGRPRIG